MVQVVVTPFTTETAGLHTNDGHVQHCWATPAQTLVVVLVVVHPVVTVTVDCVLYVHPEGHACVVGVSQLTHASPFTRVSTLLAVVLMAEVSQSTVVKLFFTASSDMVDRSNWFDADVVSAGELLESLFESAVPVVLGTGEAVWNAYIIDTALYIPAQRNPPATAYFAANEAESKAASTAFLRVFINKKVKSYEEELRTLSIRASHFGRIRSPRDCRSSRRFLHRSIKTFPKARIR